MIKQRYSTELTGFRKQMYNELTEKRMQKDATKSQVDIQAWKDQISDIKEINVAIKKGISTLTDFHSYLSKNNPSSSMISILEEIIGDENNDPDYVFKKLNKYVKMVTAGINPSVIICGSPGVGKTYRIKEQLRKSGYLENHNLYTIKGRCTARHLYMTLYNFKDSNDIVVIDDADGLVGPKAPEDCINILKSALDSTEDPDGRLVSYSVGGKLLDEDGIEIPKKFYYKGGIIVITNYNAGALDTAFRGRSFIQDINFTTDQMLQIVKELMPAIDPNKLSPKAKMKAYNYLVELAHNPRNNFNISVRTFSICAKIFESAMGDSNFSEQDARGMIKEQMKLQTLRNRLKY